MTRAIAEAREDCCCFGFVAAPDVARAQADYPSRPIKLLVPFTAGGGVDTVARILGDDLKGILGQPVVIENMPGASGMRGAEAAVRSEPDGYTLLLSSAGEAAVNPHLFKNIKYDPERDFAPITLVVKVPNVLVVNAASGINSLDDLIAFTKKATLTRRIALLGRWRAYERRSRRCDGKLIACSRQQSACASA